MSIPTCQRAGTLKESTNDAMLIMLISTRNLPPRAEIVERLAIRLASWVVAAE